MPLQNSEIKQKALNGMIEKYGVEYFTQTGIFTNAGYKWKDYILPDGTVTKIQGYENFLMDDLLKEFHQDEIITERAQMPEIWYIGLDGNKRRYFPDAYIPKTNTIYEVKSDWTYNADKETNDLKFQATKELGYNFELRIY